MTFKEYLLLSDADQLPIDTIVKERTVARLIIKNSLNDNARQELSKTYSVNNHTCYPNTVCEALSLLATFKIKPANNNRTPDAVVHYHEAVETVIINEVDLIPAFNMDMDIASDNNDDSTEDDSRQVTSSATVMASIINEATVDADKDQFIGASFSQLQEVDDVYEDNEPDLVCCAHVVDMENDNGVDVPDFVMDANIKAEEHNEMVRTYTAIITRHSDFIKDFELMIYHTAHRIMLKSSSTVGIFHYEP
jgi:hypothetical protein